MNFLKFEGKNDEKINKKNNSLLIVVAMKLFALPVTAISTDGTESMNVNIVTK